MKLSTVLAAGVAALGLTFAAAGAQAATLYSASSPTAEMESPASTSISFNAAAGQGLTSFRINGFRSLDGAGYYEDTFTLSLNGTAIYSGTWNLGGGGDNVVYLAPAGSSTNSVYNGYYQGGYTDISVPLSLIGGQNTLTFSFASTGYAGPQGLGDEAWSLSNVQVSGVSAVPEPATWAMMIIGFGAIGATLRDTRRKGVVAV